HHVTVYHTGRSDEAPTKIVEVVEETIEHKEEPKKETLSEKLTGLFKRSPAHLDYPVSEAFEGPLSTTSRYRDIEGHPLTHSVAVYHSGRSDEVPVKQETDIADTAKAISGKLTGLFKRSPAHLDYPTSEPFTGELQHTG